MSPLASTRAGPRPRLDPYRGGSGFEDLHRPFQTGVIDGALFGPESEVVIQLQQLLISVLGPLLRAMQGGALDVSPTNPQGYGGVDGFFRDVQGGLLEGEVPPSTPTYPPSAPPYPPSNPSRPPYGEGEDLPVGETIPTELDYRDLDIEERRDISGLSDRERAVLHLWGIQMTSEGAQDGGVLLNVEDHPEQFQAAEVELARELRERDLATHGGVTGKSLDEAFFALYEDMTGEDIQDRYADAPIRFADGPIDMSRRLTGDNGLTGFENQVLQLWGHAPLFNQGQIDGNIVDYALNSEHALEANLVRSDLEALRTADLASDGVLNGDSLENAFVDTLDRLYLGGPGASAEKTLSDAFEEAGQRRDGLPPLADDGAVDETNSVSPPRPGQGGGHCPFLAGSGG